MRKWCLIIISTIISVLVLLGSLFFAFKVTDCANNIEKIAGCANFIFNILGSNEEQAETLLQTSVSPNKTYTIEAYRTEPGATVDFSVKAYLVTENEKILIYNSYHESNVTINWISDTVVVINDKKLNLINGETYDWRDS